MNYHLA